MGRNNQYTRKIEAKNSTTQAFQSTVPNWSVESSPQREETKLKPRTLTLNSKDSTPSPGGKQNISNHNTPPTPNSNTFLEPDSEILIRIPKTPKNNI